MVSASPKATQPDTQPLDPFIKNETITTALNRVEPAPVQEREVVIPEPEPLALPESETATRPEPPQAGPGPSTLAKTKPVDYQVIQPSSCAIEPGPFQRAADWKLGLKETTETVRKGESFSVVLNRLGFDAGEAHLVADAAGQVMDLTKVRPGSEVTLYRERETGQSVRLEYTRPGIPRMVILKTPAGYTASWHKFEPVRCVSASEGKIKTSLWGSAVNLKKLEPELVMNFADIFRYDVDFLTEVQKGDSFRLLYETNYCQGDSVGSGRILAAEFINNGEKHDAFYYENKDGNGGYYDARGRSLKKMFLKSPLQYRRISSYYSHARMHPILKYVRPHLGVDYSAPKGTPVESIGDGVVTFVDRKGGYGKLVVIKHNTTYTTMYAHLSKYAPGLKKGQRIKQGQLIGFVGATGLATGPHLDFRVKENSKFINPLSVKLIPDPPLDPSAKPAFLAEVSHRRAELARLLAAESVNRP